MKKILLCSMNLTDQGEVKEHLIQHEYSVTIEENPLGLIALPLQEHYDLIIMDYDYNNILASDIISFVRKSNLDIKIIVLETKSEPMYKAEIELLNLGISFFLRKEYLNIDLLLKYIELALASTRFAYFVAYDNKNKIHVNSDITIDIQSQEVRKNNELIDLSKKELTLLLYFIEKKGIVLSRETILMDVWAEAEHLSSERVIDSHIKNIRKKLNIPNIVSVHGRGYKWINDINQ